MSAEDAKIADQIKTDFYGNDKGQISSNPDDFPIKSLPESTGGIEGVKPETETPEEVPEQPDTKEVKPEEPYKDLSPEELSGKTYDYIQNNIKTDPKVVEPALTEGATALTQAEMRIKADSRNINYQGIDIEASHNAYMDYISRKGSIETAAAAMAEDIRSAVSSGELSGTEIVKLQSALTDIVGDTKLAGAFIRQGIGTNANIGEGTGNESKYFIYRFISQIRVSHPAFRFI